MAAVRIAVLLLCCTTATSALKMPAAASSLGRRAVVGGTVALAWAGPLRAAEPEPMVTLTPEEEAARLERKKELLRKQDRRGKADAKLLFGNDYQAGKREIKKEGGGGFSLPFLLPNDVGGVNTQLPQAQRR